MLSIKLDILWVFLMICRVSHCERRIVGGTPVSSEKPYVVYLVKASLSERDYDSWLCGGAIVNSEFVITSAACVEDVKYLFVVAGYSKYVNNTEINEDKCTSSMKKKVIFTCVPISYDFDFDRIEKWSQIDIALAKVESPFDFDDENYDELCSYKPSKIAINFDPKYQTPETDCMMLGWGHAQKWRQHADTNNYNSEHLKYASSFIIDKEKCLSEFQFYPKMTPIIDQYMICTSGIGKIDDSGLPIDDLETHDLLDGCDRRRTGGKNISCKGGNDEYRSNRGFISSRREVPETDRIYHYNYTTNDYIRDARNQSFRQTRRNGICQNDHGGPVITWVGSTEVLIGVASVFKIDKDKNCMGPYLHTSTQNNAAFIGCILDENNNQEDSKDATRQKALCDSPPNVRGFDMVKNHISWKNHPQGPAENELLAMKLGSKV